MATPFDFYQIRAVVQTGTDCTSFLGRSVECPETGRLLFPPSGAYDEACAFANEHGIPDHKVFWTVYGCAGAETLALGDFTSFDGAHDLLSRLLAPYFAIWDSADGCSSALETMATDAIAMSSSPETL